MPIYFLVLDGGLFHQQVRPALAASWLQRNFEPCRALCADLVSGTGVRAQPYWLNSEDLLLARVAEGLPFERHFWRLLVGELLFYTATAIPEIETSPEALCCLLGFSPPGAEILPREDFAPIHQVLFGTRDLVFGGGFYRPEHAGYNDTEDVARLADYLHAIDPSGWTTDGLSASNTWTTDEERTEELEFVREWFPPLQELYQQARRQGQILVCEVL